MLFIWDGIMCQNFYLILIEFSLILAAINAACVDRNRSCSGWAARGECQKNPLFMLKNCRKSCNNCGGRCRDSYNAIVCQRWAASGQCQRNPGWMRVNCKKSCNACERKKSKTGSNVALAAPAQQGLCRDIQNPVTCKNWARSGECRKNPGYMKVYCKKSCKACKATTFSATKDNCRDLHYEASCKQWARGGQCQRNAWVKTQCKKSCGLCRVDGGYGKWTKYGRCSVSCGGGIKTRSRQCNSPKPQNGGKQCTGLSIQRIKCNTKACPAHGGYSKWSGYGPCSVSCGVGTKTRSRQCNSPRPKNGGRQCVGPSTQRIKCNPQACPVHGGYSKWSKFGPCSVSCGGGTKIRFRQCNNPRPKNGGKKCVGPSTQRIKCNPQACPGIKAETVCQDDPGQAKSCPRFKRYCRPTSKWYEWMQDHCKKTCGFCKIGSASVDKVDQKNNGINDEACGLRVKARVVGGSTVSMGDWPWQVGLASKRNPQSVICGGSLINNQWVLSAAHCFGRAGKLRRKPEDYVIRIAEHDLTISSNLEKVIPVAKIIRHEGYKIWSFDNDIALLKLAKPVQYNRFIKPVCLPNPRQENKEREWCYVTGWGRVGEFKSTAQVLQEARIPIIKQQTCKNTVGLGTTYTDNMFCAGFKKGKIDSCQGDSGGPFVCNRGGRFQLAGVVSWGKGCARANTYGVYTKVSNYIEWIKEMIIKS